VQREQTFLLFKGEEVEEEVEVVEEEDRFVLVEDSNPTNL
jgi:hypothetical protein